MLYCVILECKNEIWGDNLPKHAVEFHRYELLWLLLLYAIVTTHETTDSHDDAKMVTISAEVALDGHDDAKMATVDVTVNNNEVNMATVLSSITTDSHDNAKMVTSSAEVATGGQNDNKMAIVDVTVYNNDVAIDASTSVKTGSHDDTKIVTDSAEMASDSSNNLITAISSAEVATDSHNEEEMEIRKLDARSKRQINSLPLVFPYGGTYRLILAFTTPVHNLENVNFVMLCGILYQYVQFQNITQLSQYFVYNTVSREQRAAEWEGRRDERLVLYRAAEDMMNSKGLNGHECVLRAICEAAQYPVKDDGLVGELMHILLTPNYGRTEFDAADPDWEASMSAYTSAYAAGRQMFSCSYIYGLCPDGAGLLDLITVLRNE